MTESISRIIVYVTESRAATATVEAAGRLADSLDATLIGLHAKDDGSVAAMAPGGAISPGLIEDLQEQSDQRAQRARQSFESVLKKHDDWKGEWRCIEDRGISMRDGIAREAYLSDVIVAGQDDPDEEIPSSAVIVQDLIVDAGRPVVISPQGWTGGIGEKHVVIAWKASREAARAVHDAMPFLTRAEKVTVISACLQRPTADDDKEEPGVALCRYLEEHGIKAQSSPLYGVEDSDAGSALIKQAQDVEADLMVLGGYSHSRLREGIFGGVTRDVIDNATVPALLSH